MSGLLGRHPISASRLRRLGLFLSPPEPELPGGVGSRAPSKVEEMPGGGIKVNIFMQYINESSGNSGRGPVFVNNILLDQDCNQD